MRTLFLTILLTATICSAQTVVGTFTIYPGVSDTTISIRTWYRADSTATFARGLAARPLEIVYRDTGTTRIDTFYYFPKDLVDLKFQTDNHYYQAIDKLTAGVKQYNDPIIRTSLSASALATLTQSFPPSTLILAVIRNSNGTTTLTYQTVKP